MLHNAVVPFELSRHSSQSSNGFLRVEVYKDHKLSSKVDIVGFQLVLFTSMSEKRYRKA